MMSTVGEVFHDVVAADALSSREKVLRLEAVVATAEQLEIPVRNYFAPGIYAREATILAGTVVVGKIHKYSHLCIISKGAIAIVTEEGARVIRAPATFVSPPGTKRAGYALEDTVWTTIHGTDETDLVKIEADFIAQDYDEYERHVALLEAQ